MKRLTQDELDTLSSLSNDKILRMLTRWSDRVFLINKQNEAGIKHKSDSDPDVAKLKIDYQAIKTEITKRAGNQSLIKYIDDIEIASNLIAWSSAQGGLGIPDHEKLPLEILQAKEEKNSIWLELKGRLK